MSLGMRVPQLSYACNACSIQFIYMHASLYCLVLFISSVVFTISRSVNCRRGTDTREGRREGVRGEGMEDRGRN